MFCAVVEYVTPPKHFVPTAFCTNKSRPTLYPSGIIVWPSSTSSSFETLCASIRDTNQSVRLPLMPSEEDGETHARKTAPVSAKGPFWKYTRKWFPPMRDSRQVPSAALPKSCRSSMLWFTAPWPSPRLAENGSPRWMPRHSFELSLVNASARNLQGTRRTTRWPGQS